MRIAVCVKQIPDPATPYELAEDTHRVVRPNDQVLDDTDRFGVEVTLPLHIDLTPVNDPVSLSLVHNGAEDSPLSTVLSGITPAAFGMWNTSLTVDEDAPLSFTVSAFDEADGIVTSAVGTLIRCHTVHLIRKRYTRATFRVGALHGCH